MRSQRRLYRNQSVVSLIPNTFIGGVASEIPTKAALATKLSISESSISYFAVVGSDIEAAINVEFQLKNSAFSNTNITYYDDREGKVTSATQYTFYPCAYFKWHNFPRLATFIQRFVSDCPIFGPEALYPLLISVTSGLGWHNSASIEILYIPKCTQLGASVLYNNNFGGMANLKKIYCHPSLETINSGSPDGDLQSAASLGVEIIYVTNFTPPNAVTNLSIGTKYGSALQLNFTPPSSVNEIEFYECYTNGIYKNNISGSGGHITGLNLDTPYTITIKAVDIYLNKSGFSNSESIITNSGEDIATGLVSYYKLDEISGTTILDSFGSNNGISNAATKGVTGKINKAISCTGTGGVVISSGAILFNKGALSIWVKSSNFGSGFRGIFFKPQDYGLLTNNNIIGTYNWASGFISTGVNIADGNWHHIVYNFNQGVADGTEFYIDGALVLTATSYKGASSNSLCIGENNGQQFSTGLFDEAALYNDNLTIGEISDIYNNGNGLTI